MSLSDIKCPNFGGIQGANYHEDEDLIVNKVCVIGPAIVDVLANPVNFEKIRNGTLPMESIIMTYGGNALNESVILKKLGSEVEIISNVGNDQAGTNIIEFLKSCGIEWKKITVDEKVSTSINIVLVDENGERFFLTNPKGSMRKLKEQDVLTFLNTQAKYVSFSGLFISPQLDIKSTERLFSKIKQNPERVLAVDMTKAKNGETLSDLRPILRYVDYIFPNEQEIALLTGLNDTYSNAHALVDAGVKCAVITCGEKGCLICTKDKMLELPAYPVKKAIDSTGAGDSFVAGFLYALQSGFSLEKCGMFANATASCIVETLGATQGMDSARKPLERLARLLGKE